MWDSSMPAPSDYIHAWLWQSSANSKASQLSAKMQCLEFSTLTVLLTLFPHPGIVPVLPYQLHKHSLAANNMLETDHIKSLQIGATHAAMYLCCRAKFPSWHTPWGVSCAMRSYAISPTSLTILSSICTAHTHSWTPPRQLSPFTSLSSPQP